MIDQRLSCGAVEISLPDFERSLGPKANIPFGSHSARFYSTQIDEMPMNVADLI